MDRLLDVVQRTWGYTGLRSLQLEAMTAALDRRDSLVVLPTGGGKSLCYQAPALLSDQLTVVVSPLISLMKDQVDRLLSRGVPAAFLNSSLDTADRNRVQAGVARGDYKLLFVAPERFAAGGFTRLLEAGKAGAFAIDEAHCISHWGHDFREEYRDLGQLKDLFPDASVHAFTATATPRVRKDIIEQLRLKDPALLVGDFFRPNLRYRVERRGDAFEDALKIIRAHPGAAGIIYCIRRADVDELAADLKRARVRAAAYHAGMDDDARTRTQDRFAAGEVDVIVATVAFGMGIDRADVRFVIHAAMPQSLEHYQQESGRAGRDGQPADCVLFHSGQDYRLWESLMKKSEAADLDERKKLLSAMYSYCTGGGCRHRRLVEYFGQAWSRGPCGACDVCSGSLAVRPDSTVLAQKILSAVARTGQRFGAAHVADVLVGKKTDKVAQYGHDTLSTFGLLAGDDKPAIIGWIDQLEAQEILLREGEYRVLKITGQGNAVLRSQAEAVLHVAGPAKAARGKAKTPDEPPVDAPEEVAPSADDAALFEQLRQLRRRLAEERGVPAYMILSDKTLRLISKQRPATREALLAISGIGTIKLQEFGKAFLSAVKAARE